MAPDVNGVDYGQLIDDLAEAGYSPIDTIEAPTVDYFAARGWDAVRHNGDTLSFVRFSEEGSKILTTTPSGAIASEASFSADTIGLRMFAAAAAFVP
jgi:hypothetical protein